MAALGTPYSRSGTVLNNQFGGTDAWTKYLTTLESVTPKIEAIAVTDYYITDTYEEVLRHHIAGRLPDVQFVSRTWK